MVEHTVSREYKLMLRSDCFRGDQESVISAGKEFWQVFKREVEDDVLGFHGKLDTLAKKRRVRFFDTESHRLFKKHSYILRERRKVDGAKRRITLKFRHLDRYIALDRDMTSAYPSKGKTKFEEDIKPKFRILHSHSSRLTVRRKHQFRTMKDAVDLFPALKYEIESYEPEEKLKIVNGFEALEIVVDGGAMRIDSAGIAQGATCALIAWYKHKDESRNPLLVEFSFRYRNKQGEFTGESSERAFDIFRVLQDEQSELARWVEPRSRTKTGCVYGSEKWED